MAWLLSCQDLSESVSHCKDEAPRLSGGGGTGPGWSAGVAGQLPSDGKGP